MNPHPSTNASQRSLFENLRRLLRSAASSAGFHFRAEHAPPAKSSDSQPGVRFARER
jgi:hypothetical protein